MDQQNGFYRQTGDLIGTFFDEKLPLAISRFIADKNQPFLNWLTETYSAILKIKKDDPQRHKKIVRELNERIQQLHLLLEDENLTAAGNWLQIINKGRNRRASRKAGREILSQPI